MRRRYSRSQPTFHITGRLKGRMCFTGFRTTKQETGRSSEGNSVNNCNSSSSSPTNCFITNKTTIFFNFPVITPPVSFLRQLKCIVLILSFTLTIKGFCMDILMKGHKLSLHYKTIPMDNLAEREIDMKKHELFIVQKNSLMNLT